MLKRLHTAHMYDTYTVQCQDLLRHTHAASFPFRHAAKWPKTSRSLESEVKRSNRTHTRCEFPFRQAANGQRLVDLWYGAAKTANRHEQKLRWRLTHLHSLVSHSYTLPIAAKALLQRQSIQLTLVPSGTDTCLGEG